MKGNFFKAVRVDVVIKPASPAFRTLFWFVYGYDPAKITPAVYGEIEWCLPRPFKPLCFGSATLSREGQYSGKRPSTENRNG